MALWRCTAYWTWWFSIATLVYHLANQSLHTNCYWNWDDSFRVLVLNSIMPLVMQLGMPPEPPASVMEWHPKLSTAEVGITRRLARLPTVPVFAMPMCYEFHLDKYDKVDGMLAFLWRGGVKVGWQVGWGCSSLYWYHQLTSIQSVFLKPTYILENKGPAHEAQSSYASVWLYCLQSKLLDQFFVDSAGIFRQWAQSYDEGSRFEASRIVEILSPLLVFWHQYRSDRMTCVKGGIKD